jgi:hypothetical protein
MSDQPMTPDEKREWIIKMRLKFCNRPEYPETSKLITAQGMLNQEYFEPPADWKLYPQIQREWTEEFRGLLIQGIKEFGIGQFRSISQKYLPDWTPNELRLKTIKLIGRQNLSSYKNWKGGEEEIAEEYRKNKEIGQKFGCWKGGCLVNDDEGLIEESMKIKRVKTCE